MFVCRKCKFLGEGKLFKKKFPFPQAPILSKTLKRGQKNVLFCKISVAKPIFRKVFEE